MQKTIRLSVSEAARLFGISDKTIRRAIQDKKINYIVVAGRYKVNFESLVRWSQEKTHIKNKTEKYGLGQYVDKWKISSTLFSPRPPKDPSDN
ncbi:helix-turn-helix domain-containing protein [Patescibacteria group bacterium]|nr:helix-turn-helix domain-containing protein [Patescibacteria group bacterium]MBU1922131.1 helix-turn-helix domain-containing protein [Patescibacteria group bacterium]